MCFISSIVPGKTGLFKKIKNLAGHDSHDLLTSLIPSRQKNSSIRNQILINLKVSKFPISYNQFEMPYTGCLRNNVSTDSWDPLKEIVQNVS